MTGNSTKDEHQSDHDEKIEKKESNPEEVEEENQEEDDEDKDMPELHPKAVAYIKSLMVEKIKLNHLEYPNAIKLIEKEIKRVQLAGRAPPKENRYIDILQEFPIKVSAKVLVPVKKYPKFNFIGKILGPKGNSLKRLQEDTMCRITVMGRGSMRDAKREEELRNSLEPKYGHLSDELNVDISALAPPAEAHARMSYALAEIKKFMTPDKSDDISLQQMEEMERLTEKQQQSSRFGGSPAGLRSDQQSILDKARMSIDQTRYRNQEEPDVQNRFSGTPYPNRYSGNGSLSRSFVSVDQDRLDESRFARSADQGRFGGATNETRFGRPTEQRFGGSADETRFGRSTEPSRFGGSTFQSRYSVSADETRFGRVTDQSRFGESTDDTRFGRTVDQSRFSGPTVDSRFSRAADPSRFDAATDQNRYGGPTDKSRYGGDMDDDNYEEPIEKATSNPPKSNLKLPDNYSAGVYERRGDTPFKTGPVPPSSWKSASDPAAASTTPRFREFTPYTRRSDFRT